MPRKERLMAFKALKLNDTILRALADEGYETPTPIQAKAIPPILEGKDVLGCAQTGTGKTAAFALPMIQRLCEMPIDKSQRGARHPRALILSPTRELAAQIGDSFATYGRHAGLSHTVIFGGVSQHHQVKAIHRGVDIIVATPGRLMDLMEQRIVTLKDVSIFVLDEADRMLDMGFIEPIRRIASQLPRPRQTLLFSATMPREIMHLADSLLKEPVKVTVTPVASMVPLIEQKLYMVQMRQKMALLEYLLDDKAVQRVLVFTKTKHGADRVCKNLNQDGVPAIAIHGNKAQNYRTRALDAFRSGKARVLVATDVAARGLDVDGITHVVNFDLPMEPEAYVHRIGRTGRAGNTGIAISFCDANERDLLRSIQRLTGKQIPVEQMPTDLPTNDHNGSIGRDENRERGPRGVRGGFRDERGARNPRIEQSQGPSYGQSYGQSTYRPAQQRGSGGGGYGDRPARDSFPPRQDRPANGQRPAHGPAFAEHAPAATVRPVVMDEHRPARPAPSAGGNHAPRHSAPADAGHAPRTPQAPRTPHAPHAPHSSENGQPAGESHETRPSPVSGGAHAGPNGVQKKTHRKGQGPATKPTRTGPVAANSSAQGGQAGHGGQRAHTGGPAFGGPRGGPAGRGDGEQSRGRRGGPGGGTRGKIFSRGGPRGSAGR